MPHLISVRARDSGWLVESEALDRILTFSSGAQAETAARGMGERYARAGREAEVRVYLRDGSLGGRIVFARSARAALAVA